MDVAAAKLIAMALAITFAAAGAAVGMGLIGGKSVEAIGRNPETENTVRTNMIIGFVFVETTLLFALLVALIIRFVG